MTMVLCQYRQVIWCQCFLYSALCTRTRFRNETTLSVLVFIVSFAWLGIGNLYLQRVGLEILINLNTEDIGNHQGDSRTSKAEIALLDLYNRAD